MRSRYPLVRARVRIAEDGAATKRALLLCLCSCALLVAGCSPTRSSGSDLDPWTQKPGARPTSTTNKFADALQSQLPEPCHQEPENAEVVETRCDGIDNDCDGVIDGLVPVAANACTPTNGTCGVAYAACIGGQRVCLGTGPSPEVWDGIDNDCNGVVDDTTTDLTVSPRVLVLRPTYLQVDSLDEIDSVASFLTQWGIPYDLAGPFEDFDAQLAQLDGHTLAILPSYVIDSVFTGTRGAKLESFVSSGGILVAFKPFFEDPSSGTLLGISGSEPRRDLDTINFVAATGAVRSFDSPEELSVPLTTADAEDPPEAFVLAPTDPSIQVLAEARKDGVAVGPLVTYRPVGAGGVYALGHDLHNFVHARCYINCFEPSGDLAGLFLREAFRDSGRGHVVMLHTVPGPEDSLVIVSHDVDAPDAQNAGRVWGKPGAVQVAELEQRHGARGSFMVTTDYVTGYYSPPMLATLCSLNMCPVGTHSVTHPNLSMADKGSCAETAPGYGTSITVCGEINVSISLLERDVGKRPIAWRAPYLGVPPTLFDVLSAAAIVYDSSFSVGDLKFNLPVSLEHTGFQQWLFHRKPMYSSAISVEDGIGDMVEGKETRHEMSADNAPLFVHNWTLVMLRNAQNRAHTVALLHPSYGRNVPQDNLMNKLAVLDTFLTATQERGLKFDATFEDLYDFWHAREQVQLDEHYAGGMYTGTLTIGDYAMKNLTLEFGDSVNDFSCATCGSTQTVGGRVVIGAELAPHSKHTFVADAHPR